MTWVLGKRAEFRDKLGKERGLQQNGWRLARIQGICSVTQLIILGMLDLIDR